jgi:hypothetical protein
LPPAPLRRCRRCRQPTAPAVTQHIEVERSLRFEACHNRTSIKPVHHSTLAHTASGLGENFFAAHTNAASFWSMEKIGTDTPGAGVGASLASLDSTGTVDCNSKNVWLTPLRMSAMIWGKQHMDNSNHTTSVEWRSIKPNVAEGSRHTLQSWTTGWSATSETSHWHCAHGSWSSRQWHLKWPPPRACCRRRRFDRTPEPAWAWPQARRRSHDCAPLKKPPYCVALPVRPGQQKSVESGARAIGAQPWHHASRLPEERLKHKPQIASISTPGSCPSAEIASTAGPHMVSTLPGLRKRRVARSS